MIGTLSIKIEKLGLSIEIKKQPRKRMMKMVVRKKQLHQPTKKILLSIKKKNS
jgi:hypothetical protein